VQAFRDALERSRTALESNVTLPRERVQEVVDDAVKRGRMTRADANELVSKLVSRSRKATDDLIRDLEKLLEQARKEVESTATKARKELEARGSSTRRQAKRAGERAARAARDAADRPLAEADKLRRRAGAPGPAITGYDQLTAGQVKSRLKDLSKAELRKVRTQENRGKARKGVLDAIDKQLK
jgi:polyhydroxyalkanoate synthesis regulator phasin